MKLRRFHFRHRLSALLLAAGLAGAQTPTPPPSRPARIGAVILQGPAGPREDVPADIVLRSGHAGRVTALQFSPDGSMLATAGEDKMVLLWDPRTGSELKSFQHAAGIRSMALSPDGALVAAGAEDGSIAIWSVSTGKIEKSMAAYREPVAKLAFSPDGTKLASGGGAGYAGSVYGDAAGSVRVWDVAAGRELRTIDPNAIGLTGVFFAADGKSVFVATAEGDMEIRGTIRQFDIETGALVSTRPGILRAASGDGRWLAMEPPGEAQQLRLIEAPDRVVASTARTIGPVAFSPQGDWVAYGSQAESVFHVQSTQGAAVREPIRGYDWSREKFALSPGGTLLAATDGGSSITIWDTATGGIARALTPFGAGALAFRPDEKVLAGGSQGDSGLRVWDLASKRQLNAADLREGVIAMAFSPDGRHLAAGSRVLRLWDANTLAVVREFRSAAGVVTSPTFSPDGRLLAGNSRGIVSIWDVTTGAELRRFGEYEMVTAGALALSPDGRHVAAGAGTGSVKIYSIESGQPQQSLSLPGNPSALAFSADGALLAAGSRAAIRVQQGPDGRAGLERIAGQAASLAVWELKTGRRLFVLSVGDWVSAVAITRDGKYMLAAFGDMYQPGAVKLFDAATGQEVRTLVEKVDAERAAVFSPRLSYLAGGAAGGGVKLWKLPELH